MKMFGFTNRNLYNKSKPKGTIDIEFMLSIFLFLTVLTFVSFSVINKIPVMHQESFSQDIRAKAFQISEILMFDAGSPAGWESGGIGAVKRIGLSSGTRYYLDTNKITALNIYCGNQNNYNTIKNLLGFDYTNDVVINISETSSGTQKLFCAPGARSLTRPSATITRIGTDLSSGNMLTVMVSIL